MGLLKVNYIYKNADKNLSLDDLAKEVTEIQNAWDDLCNSQKESIELLKSGNKANPKYASSLIVHI